MNPRVLEATAIEGHKLKLLFDNGELGFYDCSPLSNFGVFQGLQDKSYFKKVKAVDRTVVWPHGQDICPDTQYGYGGRRDNWDAEGRFGEIERDAAPAIRKIIKAVKLNSFPKLSPEHRAACKRFFIHMLLRKL